MNETKKKSPLMMKQRNSPPIEFNSRKIEKKSHKLELHFEKRKEKN